MRKMRLLTTFLCGAAIVCCGGASRADEPAAGEIGVADLLMLPNDPYAYKVDEYLDAARSLQALGKGKACALLKELAAKELFAKNGWPFLRTVTLCRMLFRAKPKGTFRRAGIGAWGFVGKRDSDDWPLEPIAIVDGVPFLVADGAMLGGLPKALLRTSSIALRSATGTTSNSRPRRRTRRKKHSTACSRPRNSRASWRTATRSSWRLRSSKSRYAAGGT